MYPNTFYTHTHAYVQKQVNTYCRKTPAHTFAINVCTFTYTYIYIYIYVCM